jgi:hypothetical protein
MIDCRGFDFAGAGLGREQEQGEAIRTAGNRDTNACPGRD